MMNTLKFHKVEEFLNSIDLNDDLANTLFMFDIDGVFFEGILDPRFWFSSISPVKLSSLAQITNKESNVWIFTDRHYFGFWGPYKRQLATNLGLREQKVEHFEGSKVFNQNGTFPKRAFIKNANKPHKESVTVLKNALQKFDKIYYIAAQDLPFVYDDRAVIEALGTHSEKLTFVDIR